MHSISVIIPAFNYADYLGFAIDSLLDQHYPGLEVVIVNDGSTDQTGQVMQGYRDKHSHQIKCMTQPNKGAGSARNAGARLATGDYLIFLDADDRMLPGALAEINKLLLANPEVDALFAAHTVVRSEHKIETHHAPIVTHSNKNNFLKILNKDFPAPTGSYTLKREVLNTIQFSERITNYEDGIFLAHLVARHQIMSVDKPVVAIHRHDDSLRSRIDPDNHPANLLCDILFDRNIIPSELLAYRNKYKANHLLRLFRRSILNKNYSAAKKYYHEAIKANIYSLFNLRYLKKYLVMMVKSFTLRA